MHQLQSSITSESWKTLSSRPIRGAESDPMKEPSRVLYKLLKIMLDQFRGKFSSLGFDKSLEFPVLRGCDDYLDRLHDVKLVSSRMMETVMLTADLSDAFTDHRSSCFHCDTDYRSWIQRAGGQCPGMLIHII